LSFLFLLSIFSRVAQNADLIQAGAIRLSDLPAKTAIKQTVQLPMPINKDYSVALTPNGSATNLDIRVMVSEQSATSFNIYAWSDISLSRLWVHWIAVPR